MKELELKKETKAEWTFSELSGDTPPPAPLETTNILYALAGLSLRT